MYVPIGMYLYKNKNLPNNEVCSFAQMHKTMFNKKGAFPLTIKPNLKLI